MLPKSLPEAVQINGRALKCVICAHESFHKRKTHFDTAIIRSLNPEWVESSGYCLICHQCGFIHSFVES